MSFRVASSLRRWSLARPDRPACPGDPRPSIRASVFRGSRRNAVQASPSAFRSRRFDRGEVLDFPGVFRFLLEGFAQHQVERRFVGISSYQHLREGGETCGGPAGIVQAASLSLLGGPTDGNAAHLEGRGGKQGGVNAQRLAS